MALKRRYRGAVASTFAGAALTVASILAPAASSLLPAVSSSPAYADEAYSVASPNALVLPSDLKQMANLPTWVQAKGNVRLYTADRGNGVASTVSANTFLSVLGGGTSRLYVQVMAPDGNRMFTAGWVDPTTVAPSAPPTGWLRNFRATSLYSTSAPDAPTSSTLAQWTFVQSTGAAANGRLPVTVFDGSFRPVASGWVNQADLGPVGPPTALVSAPRTTDTPSNPYPTQAAFLSAISAAAKQAQAQTGVPAAVTIAQAILESSWGQSGLSRSANNYFGIKATGTLGDDGAVWMSTQEYTSDGSAYMTVAPFRAYKSMLESVVDHDLLFVNLSIYRSAMAARNDPKEFAQQIQQDGYATDPSYADKLIALMDKYNLYQYDG